VLNGLEVGLYVFAVYSADTKRTLLCLSANPYPEQTLD